MKSQDIIKPIYVWFLHDINKVVDLIIGRQCHQRGYAEG
jgi:hypothetical protein